MAEICRALGAEQVQVAASAAERDKLWQARRSVSAALGRLRPNKLGEDIVVPKSEIPAMIAAVRRDRRRVRPADPGVRPRRRRQPAPEHPVRPARSGRGPARRARRARHLPRGAAAGRHAQRRARRGHAQARVPRGGAGPARRRRWRARSKTSSIRRACSIPAKSSPPAAALKVSWPTCQRSREPPPANHGFSRRV